MPEIEEPMLADIDDLLNSRPSLEAVEIVFRAPPDTELEIDLSKLTLEFQRIMHQVSSRGLLKVEAQVLENVDAFGRPVF